MSLDPAASLLADGDYDRLGVRRSEARPRVIRHAAHQMAGPLAQQHLRAPDGPTEDALAQVVTSAYRLLDPRRRNTPTERALLAQEAPVPPIVPRWVHPTAKTQRAGPLPPPSPLNRLPLHSLPCDAALFPDYMAASPTAASPTNVTTSGIDRPRRLLPAVVAAHLPSQLVPSQLLPSHLDRRRAILAGGLLAVLLVAALLLTLRAIRTPSVSDQAEPASAPAPATSAASPASASAATPDPNPADDASPQIAARTPASDPTAPSGPEPVAAAAEPLRLGFSRATPPAQEEPPPAFVRAPISKPVDKEPVDKEPVDKEPVDKEPVGKEPVGKEPVDKEPVGKEPVDTEPVANEPAATVAAALPPAEAEGAGGPAAGQAALPSSTRLQASQGRIQKLLADRPEAVTERQQLQQIEWLLGLRDESPPASADGLAIAQLVVAKLVTIGRHRQAAAIIDELEGRFDVEPTQLCLSTTEQLVDSAASLADHRRIVAWCLSQSERYLQAERFDGATETVRLGTISAVKLADAELRGRLNQRRDAISAARRSADAVHAIMARAAPGEASSSDAAQVGRYLCLMLRDWEQGVAWLAQGADPRLASVAQQELQLREGEAGTGENEDAEATLDGGRLAAAWLQASARFRGRLDESSKLHAYDLIQKALQQSAGLRTLELNKQREALAEQLPADLLPPPEPTAAAAAAAAAPPPPDAIPASSGVMEGRLTVDGRDTGTLIRYSPGIRLGQNVIDQIFGALKQPVVPWTLTFHGVLRLDQASTVRFITAGPAAPDGTTKIQVDRTPLQLASSVRGEAAKLDLPAGLHQVRWQIAGQQLDEAFLLVQDEISGERLELSAPPAPLGALPPRLRINIQRAP